MEITEVRVKLVEGGRDKLRAFCSITIDDAFVVRDLKVIDGTKGLFVAMPSRKLTSRCTRCGFKNQVRSNYCNDCGTTLPDDAPVEGGGKSHADIAHPIHTDCRELLQTKVIDAYHDEVEASRGPDYRPRDLDDDDESPRDSVRTPVFAGGDAERGEDRREPRERGFERGAPPARGPITDLDADPRARAGEAAARDETPVGDAPRSRWNEGSGRSSNTRRQPLSEMPPPDDNFSAGIF